ncbi:hypothetical protein BDZ91DRAFT_708408 [Kalaharituber pfeilii]|nr:hypothetical protein BDZ91DRAFT_708408 [Kalaharituber pfeilii]
MLYSTHATTASAISIALPHTSLGSYLPLSTLQEASCSTLLRLRTLSKRKETKYQSMSTLHSTKLPCTHDPCAPTRLTRIPTGCCLFLKRNSTSRLEFTPSHSFADHMMNLAV